MAFLRLLLECSRLSLEKALFDNSSSCCGVLEVLFGVPEIVVGVPEVIFGVFEVVAAVFEDAAEVLR